MNDHIIDYINYYLTLDKPEFAVLLSGAWGSGKTYFINKYIAEFNNENNNFKFVKISLFGLKKLDKIDDEIFQQLNPILGSKPIRLIGKLAKSAISYGTRIDVDGDSKTDGSLNANLKDVNFSDYFSKNKSTKDIVFIFDDIERTEISIKEIFGYINSIVEIDKFKVILLACEEKISDSQTYHDFKEKVIGQTFELQQDLNEIIDFFIKDNEILKKNKDIIIDVYNSANYKNLRHLKQSFEDFNHLKTSINDEYLQNQEFTKSLIYQFLFLNIEVKNGSIKKDMLHSFFTKEDFKDLRNKYNFPGLIFDSKTWQEIIFNRITDPENLKNKIEGLSFFKKNESSRPSWIDLWYYFEQDDEYFQKKLTEVVNDFKEYKYSNPRVFLHVIGILLFFIKNNLTTLTIDEFNKTIETSIEHYSQKEDWFTYSDKIFDLHMNGTGLGYMSIDDTEFVQYFSKIRDKLYKTNEINEQNRSQEIIELFLSSMKNENIQSLTEILLEKFNQSAFFNESFATLFFEKMLTIKHKTLSDLRNVLSNRYSNNYFISSLPRYKYFSSELTFWIKLKELIDNYEKSPEGNNLKKLLLNSMNNYLIKDIIEKLH